MTQQRPHQPSSEDSPVADVGALRKRRRRERETFVMLAIAILIYLVYKWMT